MKKLPLGHVTVWQMTEEERLAYIAKHPIKPVPLEEEAFVTDYKWRSEKGVSGRRRTRKDETDQLQ